METLTGAQRKYLRGLAHGLEPVVLIGRLGLTDATVIAVDQALDTHELIKVKMVGSKEAKREVASGLAARTGAHPVGMVGHVLILYRRHREPRRVRIYLPHRHPA
jgi:RNA-binding protein